MVSALPLDEIQIARAAENMIREHGDEALIKADDQVKKFKSEGFDSFAKTWMLIREAIKDEQESDNKRRELAKKRARILDDDEIRALWAAEGFDSFAKTWMVIREAIKDEQESDYKRRKPS